MHELLQVNVSIAIQVKHRAEALSDDAGKLRVLSEGESQIKRKDG